MATYNITFTRTPGSYGTLIEYKSLDGGGWITPSNPANPTSADTYSLDLPGGHSYYIGVSSIGNTCSPQRRIIGPITVSPESCCPSTYTLSLDGSYCYKIEETAATAPTGGENSVATTYASYSTCGSYIYNPGYAINGTGIATQISLSIPFWKNGGTCADNNTTDGPLNRTGLWAPSPMDNQDIGFSVCIDILSTKTYYIGLGCDNYAIVNIDGNNIITQDATALGVQYSVGPSATFKVWHIYPITLTAGSHVIELIGHNVTSNATIGAEIYDGTAADISGSASYSDLGSHLIFSTKNYRGYPIQLGTGGVGYTCPSGYSLVACDIPYKCRRVDTTGTITCP